QVEGSALWQQGHGESNYSYEGTQLPISREQHDWLSVRSGRLPGKLSDWYGGCRGFKRSRGGQGVEKIRQSSCAAGLFRFSPVCSPSQDAIIDLNHVQGLPGRVEKQKRLVLFCSSAPARDFAEVGRKPAWGQFARRRAPT